MAKCFSCQSSFPGDEPGLVSCPKCGQVQILAPASPFQTLGAPKSYDLDERALEERYYQLSRVLHPDRFSGASLEAREGARKNSAEVNAAYDALKTKDARLDALLESVGALVVGDQGTEKGSSSSIPQEWAERFFELQELRMDDPEKYAKELSGFAREVAAEVGKSNTTLNSLAAKIDWTKVSNADSGISTIISERKRRAYLQSLLRQVQA